MSEEFLRVFDLLEVVRETLMTKADERLRFEEEKKAAELAAAEAA